MISAVRRRRVHYLSRAAFERERPGRRSSLSIRGVWVRVGAGHDKGKSSLLRHFLVVIRLLQQKALRRGSLNS